jgi:hypothetical protein
MSWKDLLQKEGSELVLPWFGFPEVHNARRTWTVKKWPSEHGWYRFRAAGGRFIDVLEDVIVDPDPEYGNDHRQFGYLVGNRFIWDRSQIDPNPAKLLEQTVPAYCVEPGLERFTRAVVVSDRAGHIVYLGQEFPIGPEPEVIRAYQDRAADLNGIKNVIPALDLAFRWVSQQRDWVEKRREELALLRIEEERKREEEERLQQAMKDAGTSIGRRVLAVRDFETAAREALRVSGAELLDVRDSRNRNEMIVQYRIEHRRLECVVDKVTMRIIDSGICLTAHDGVKGDTRFTLESLPGVVLEAIRGNKLVVYRHVDGDPGGNNGDDDDDW